MRLNDEDMLKKVSDCLLTRLERAPLDAVHDRRLWRRRRVPGMIPRFPRTATLFPGAPIAVLDESLAGVVREQRHLPQSLGGLLGR